jgi:hypothetical protein
MPYALVGSRTHWVVGQFGPTTTHWATASQTITSSVPTPSDTTLALLAAFLFGWSWRNIGGADSNAQFSTHAVRRPADSASCRQLKLTWLLLFHVEHASPRRNVVSRETANLSLSLEGYVP